MDIHVHLHFSPAIESLATVLSDQLQKELEKGTASAAVEAPPAEKKTKKAETPAPAPVAAATPTVDPGVGVPAPIVPAPPTAAGHTRESIKAAIQAAKLPKPKIAELLASVGAKNLTEMVEVGKIQEFGDAVQSAIGALDADPVPAAVAAPEALKGFTRESIMPLYVDAMAKDRPGLIKLLGEFNAIKLSTLEDSKIPAFGEALKNFLTPVAA
jgi:hypothetical protein